MIETCTSCKEGKIDYSMSEILLIPNSNGKKASIEGMCEKCNAHFQVFYEQTETIVTEFNDFMEEIAKTKI